MKSPKVRYNRADLLYALMFLVIAILSGAQISETPASSSLQTALILSSVTSSGVAAAFMYLSFTE